MQLWNVGDKSEAICAHCHARVKTTFALRPVRLEDEDITVSNVLVGLCDVCGNVASIPAQSAPLLGEALEKEPTKLSTRINRRLEDAIRLIASHYHVRERDFRAVLIRYYLLELSRKPDFAKRVARLAHSEITKGQKTGRLEVRLTEPALIAAWKVAKAAGLRTQTEMIEGLLAAATEDVLSDRSPRRAAQLGELAAVV